MLTNYVKAIRYLQGIEKNGEPFTIRDWMRGVREDRPNGWLFISSNADTHASLKPVISMWLSIAIRGLLAMGENRNRRVWIFADELPTLHKLPDLVEILPEARKFGGCYVFGIQSYAQLEDIYGVKPAATLFDVMNTRAFFRSPSKEIAEFAAGEIGEKEILKASEQYSYGADPVRDGVSTGKEKSGKRWSVTPIFRRCLTCPAMSRCRAVSGRETGPQIQAASENCRGIYSSHSMRGWMRGSVRCLKRGKLKAVLPGHFSRRMRRHPGPLIQTVTPVNSLSRSVSLRQQK